MISKLSAHEEKKFEEEQKSDQQSFHHVKESSVESLSSPAQAPKATASSSASSSATTRKPSASAQVRESSSRVSQISRHSSSHQTTETFPVTTPASSVVTKGSPRASHLSRSSSFVRGASDNVSLSQFSTLTGSTVRQPRTSASVVSASVNASNRSQRRRSTSTVRAASRLSDMEHVILNSTEPVVLEETEVINVNGQEGMCKTFHN